MTPRPVNTRRLIIRPLGLRDHAAWQASSRTRLPPRTPWDLGPTGVLSLSSARFRRLVRKVERLAQDDDIYIYGIFRKRTGELLGGLDFSAIHRADRQAANFGYHIHNRHWGQGYGREAAQAGLRIGFRQLGLNRLEAAIDPKNRTSIALARSIGMRSEGLRRRYLFIDGRWTDLRVFAANPEDVGLRGQKPASRT